MHRKIERQRADRPAHWTPVEEPIALGRVVQTREDILKGSLEGGHR
jgi:adenosyl cobinamide kinase/adenosyl cobinamide phosphate guanylyltransferase